MTLVHGFYLGNRIETEVLKGCGDEVRRGFNHRAGGENDRGPGGTFNDLMNAGPARKLRRMDVSDIAFAHADISWSVIVQRLIKAKLHFLLVTGRHDFDIRKAAKCRDVFEGLVTHSQLAIDHAGAVADEDDL